MVPAPVLVQKLLNTPVLASELPADYASASLEGGLTVNPLVVGSVQVYFNRPRRIEGAGYAVYASHANAVAALRWTAPGPHRIVGNVIVGAIHRSILRAAVAHLRRVLGS